jgi:hypothetical protein
MHTRARVRDADAVRGTAPPSRLRRPRLRTYRDCVAILLALAVVAEPPALTCANLAVALHTSSETKAPRSRPPRHFSLPRCRGHPSAWAHERQAKSVHMFVHVHAHEDMDAAFGWPNAHRRARFFPACKRSRVTTQCMLGRSRLPCRTSPPDLVRAGPLSFAAGVLLTHTRTRGSRALLSLSKRCTRMFTRTHALASELPHHRGHPSRYAAELEPHQAALHRAAMLVREIHLTVARKRMRSNKLSPLPSLHESGELVRACEPNLTAAQPVAARTPPSRASFPPRRASAGPTSSTRSLSSTCTPATSSGARHPSPIAKILYFAPPRQTLARRRCA